MDFLALVQSLHHEAKQPGSPPAAVTGQTGRAADLVRWIAEAYNDIQRENDGQWKWLRRDFYVNTVADDQTLASGDCTDTLAAAAIDRFRAWDVQDDDNPPFIYLVSEGVATEREIPHVPWPEFRRLYVRATHESAEPAALSVDHADTIYLGPGPDGIYRLTGHYWRSNQTLADDSDTPEMPADYHMLIVYRAMTKYAYNVIAQELVARAATDGQPLYDALVQNQWYGRFRLRYPSALA